MSTVFLSFTQRLRLYGNEDPSDGPSYTSTDIDLVKSFLFAAWLPRRHSDGCGRANASRSRCALHFDIIVFLFLLCVCAVCFVCVCYRWFASRASIPTGNPGRPSR